MQGERASGARLVILENDTVRVVELNQRTEWRIGRYDPAMQVPADVQLGSYIVSREHGRFRQVGDRWAFLDNPHNLNGTFLNGSKIPRPASGAWAKVYLSHGDVLRIDNADLNYVSAQGVLILFTTKKPKGEWTTYRLHRGRNLIGRNPSCDIVEPLPYISSFHAEITAENGFYYISDLESRAGTFLNGKRVAGRMPLREKDYISLGDCDFFFLGDKLLYSRPPKAKGGPGDVILTASIDSKRVRERGAEKELLRDININIREGSLVAVLGTAGAGKSTLMGCLSGLDQNFFGAVFYRGVDLLRELERIKYLIGYVPQEKVIRPELTPEKALMESAELRLSAETTKEEIRRRVEETLELLSMTRVRDTLNSRLSGGEQTRVNLGIDLVADRDIYFLDEPEQGLSPNLRDELYVFLRRLAHDYGKTIIAIIHDVSCIDMFDQVVFLVKANGVGRLAFSGSPAEGERHFGVPIAKAYALMEADPEKYVR